MAPQGVFAMRVFVIGLVVFLSACNGSDKTAVPVASTAVAALQARVESLEAVVNVLKASQAPDESTAVAAIRAGQAKLTLIGKVNAKGESTAAVGVGIANFGPCQDMGVLIGRGSTGSAAQPDPLSANIESFQQCTGYNYNTILGTGKIGSAPRIFWDGPNCTGNEYEWEAGGMGYNAQTLQHGVVFLSPQDGTPLMVVAGQTPQPILIQSVLTLSDQICESDIEVQLLYAVTPNDVKITGVPTTLPLVPQLVAP